MLGVSFDTVEENRAFAEAEGVGYQLLSDVDRSVGAAYEAARAPGEPYADFPQRISYLIDPDGRIAATYEVSDVAGHAAMVLADLERLRADG